jgi:hypothetical protein
MFCQSREVRKINKHEIAFDLSKRFVMFLQSLVDQQLEQIAVVDMFDRVPYMP